MTNRTRRSPFRRIPPQLMYEELLWMKNELLLTLSDLRHMDATGARNRLIKLEVKADDLMLKILPPLKEAPHDEKPFDGEKSDAVLPGLSFTGARDD
jgi:hypothetical protein